MSIGHSAVILRKRTGLEQAKNILLEDKRLHRKNLYGTIFTRLSTLGIEEQLASGQPDFGLSYAALWSWSGPGGGFGPEGSGSTGVDFSVFRRPVRGHLFLVSWSLLPDGQGLGRFSGPALYPSWRSSGSSGSAVTGYEKDLSFLKPQRLHLAPGDQTLGLYLVPVSYPNGKFSPKDPPRAG